MNVMAKPLLMQAITVETTDLCKEGLQDQGVLGCSGPYAGLQVCYFRSPLLNVNMQKKIRLCIN